MKKNISNTLKTITANYELIKPGQDDFYNVDEFNQNMDSIDKQLKVNESQIKVLSDDGKISRKGQIYNGYKGRYFSDIFPSGTSLDDIRTNVFCYMQGSDNVPNLPGGVTSANSCLEVQTCYLTDGTPYTTKQTFTRINVGSWVRFYSGADKVWTDWEPIATTEKTEVLCTANTGITIVSQKSYTSNGEFCIELRVKKTDDSSFGGSEVVVAHTPFVPYSIYPCNVIARTGSSSWNSFANAYITKSKEIRVCCNTGVSNNVTEFIISCKGGIQ